MATGSTPHAGSVATATLPLDREFPDRRKRDWNIDEILFGLALCFTPISIAVCETLLAASLAVRIFAPRRHPAPDAFVRVFRIWLVWAGLEIVAWLQSPEIRAGWGEMRHLLLIAALFLQIPILARAAQCVAVWRGIVIAATAGSLVLIRDFFSRLALGRNGLDPVIYLRSGGLLHHWMIYATIEILVFAALLQLWHFYPEHRRWLLPAVAIHAAAIVLSQTRTLWICCLLVLALDLVWRRSRWIWALPVIPCILFFISPEAIRERVEESSRPDYYSNAERVQMARVGWNMVRDHPLFGVGPGRVEKLYTGYLSPSDPVPAYHGHLHNNLIQLAAQFGLPVAAGAIVFAAFLFTGLRKRGRRADSREEQFLYRTAMLGLLGFLASGLFDYTYGHALGLILLAFAALSPLSSGVGANAARARIAEPPSALAS